MKNIHVLPTDKPTNLVFEKFSNRYFSNRKRKPNTKFITNQHIYITSDEEIKEGDYGLDTFHKEIRKFRNKNFVSKYDRKIILTTDDQLIKDGVQPIDDEFLEWFVKNPNCEEVEVKKKGISDHMKRFAYYRYEIIIPQEEHKQGYTPNSCDIIFETAALVENKQETLEEFAERLCPNKQVEYDMILEGAKWQQEQDKKLYSELIDLLERLTTIYKEDCDLDIKYNKKRLEFIEQFKKK